MRDYLLKSIPKYVSLNLNLILKVLNGESNPYRKFTTKNIEVNNEKYILENSFPGIMNEDTEAYFGAGNFDRFIFIDDPENDLVCRGYMFPIQPAFYISEYGLKIDKQDLYITGFIFNKAKILSTESEKELYRVLYFIYKVYIINLLNDPDNYISNLYNFIEPHKILSIKRPGQIIVKKYPDCEHQPDMVVLSVKMFVDIMISFFNILDDIISLHYKDISFIVDSINQNNTISGDLVKDIGDIAIEEWEDEKGYSLIIQKALKEFTKTSV